MSTISQVSGETTRNDELNEIRAKFSNYQKGNTKSVVKKQILPEAKLIVKPLHEIFKERIPTLREPRKMFGDLIPEGEITILFGRSNVGKSFLAYQIGEAIARGTNVFNLVAGGNASYGETIDYNLNNDAEPQKILYADFEASEEKVIRRYRSKKTGNYYDFHPNFIEAFAERHCVKTPSEFINRIEETVKQQDIKVVIIDNISAISTDTETTASATILMSKIKDLQENNKLTLILMAHTPKILDGKPIYWTDLAGSSKLFSLSENVMAINTAEYDKNIRYIKQFKTRYDDKFFEADNVIAMKFSENDNGFKGFSFLSYENEDELLKKLEKEEKDGMNEQIIHFVKEGKSSTRIAQILKETYSQDKSIETIKYTVQKRIQEFRRKGLLPTYEEQLKLNNNTNVAEPLKTDEKNANNCENMPENDKKTAEFCNEISGNTMQPDNINMFSGNTESVETNIKESQFIEPCKTNEPYKTKIVGKRVLQPRTLPRGVKPIQRDEKGRIIDNDYANAI